MLEATIEAPVFIIGSARSGTTSLVRALATSPGAMVRVEPTPNLNEASGSMWRGVLPEPASHLARDVAPRVAKAVDSRLTYIEKQVSLAPFVRELAEMFDARFLLPVRDGRDVVASMMDWHARMYPIIYREAGDGIGELGPHAAEVESGLSLPDAFDLSLPRPRPGDPWHEGWAIMPRFKMCCWYWNHVTTRTLDLLERHAPGRFLVVRYDDPGVRTIREVFEFAGLPGFDERRIGELLGSRVNSLRDRIGEDTRFPRHRAWDEDRRQRFHDLAHDALTRLGYWDPPTRPRPASFGAYWRDGKQASREWFEQIYDYRRPSQERFLEWAAEVERGAGPFESVIDVGSGVGHGYTDAFADRSYTGVDISPEVVELANEGARLGHRFVLADVIEDTQGLEADLVMCHASIDNMYDVDGALRALARMTRRALYISTYRDYRGSLQAHRYHWDPKMQSYFNDLCASRVERVLREAGFGRVEVFPSRTGREDHPTEMVIAAVRADEGDFDLRAGHELGFDLAPYRAEPSAEDPDGLIAVVDAACGDFAPRGEPIGEPMASFEGFARGLVEAAGAARTTGLMRDVADPDHPATLGVRVDVDLDLSSAVAMARIGRDAGLPLSFYLLHTAGYYGHWDGTVFRRHEGMASRYTALQEAGAEVGLHTDALTYSLVHGVDGAAAVRDELGWLRSIGLEITGTSGHNMVGAYGAENAEIFAERVIRPDRVARRGHVYAPLGVLREAELGLRYEAGNPRPAFGAEGPPDADPFVAGVPAHDFLRDPAWIRRYLLENPYCRWGWDVHAWSLGGGVWCAAGEPRAGERVFEFGLDADGVLELVGGTDPSRTVVITLHPVYFGRR